MHLRNQPRQREWIPKPKRQNPKLYHWATCKCKNRNC